MFVYLLKVCISFGEALWLFTHVITSSLVANRLALTYSLRRRQPHQREHDDHGDEDHQLLFGCTGRLSIGVAGLRKCRSVLSSRSCSQATVVLIEPSYGSTIMARCIQHSSQEMRSSGSLATFSGCLPGISISSPQYASSSESQCGACMTLIGLFLSPSTRPRTCRRRL